MSAGGGGSLGGGVGTRPARVTARGWGWRHPGRLAWAVRGVDLDVAPGERVLLLGPSGAGKSTLLAGLAGLLDPEDHEGGGEGEGALLLDGLPAAAARRATLGAGVARTGLLLQDPQAQTVLARCGDDVAFGLENHALPRDEIWPRVDEALAMVGFPYPRAHPTSHLSGGERQRLALAGVLALRPGLLLLDEPTAMLDPDGAAEVRDAVARVLAATGATCVVVEHRVGPWLPLVDRVVVLDPTGGLLADGAPDDVLDRHGAALAARGVWVPGHLPSVRRPAGRSSYLGSVAPHLDGPAPGLSGATVSAPADTVAPMTPVGGAPAAPATPAEVLLQARGLAAAPAKRLPAVVGGVDLDLAAGRATALVGPNGSGKTTLALVLAGLAAPTAGSLVAGPRLARGLDRPPYRWRARDLVRRIGTVFQEPQHQFVTQTVRAELEVGPRLTGCSEAETAARVDELLVRLRLDHLARANPFTLSGGEQRRLSVATALATRPGLLVLDEPTFGQDARTWAELVSLLHELVAEGTGVLTVTHDEALVTALADDVLRLSRPRAGVQSSAELVGVA